MWWRRSNASRVGLAVGDAARDRAVRAGGREAEHVAALGRGLASDAAVPADRLDLAGGDRGGGPGLDDAAVAVADERDLRRTAGASRRYVKSTPPAPSKKTVPLVTAVSIRGAPASAGPAAWLSSPVGSGGGGGMIVTGFVGRERTCGEA